jgi:hypothetical protein
MRITDAGNVGVGTTAPQSKMEIRATSGGSTFNALTLSNYVGASVNTGVALYFDPNGAGSLARAASIQSVQSTSGNYADLRFFTANSDTPAERIRITPAGNVGIGTSNPVNKFEVVGPSGGDCIMINRASNAAYFQLLGASFPTYNAIQSLDGSGNEYWGIGGYGNANTIVFRTNSGAERMRITSAGNVAIGNSNAAPKFSVTLGTGFAWGGGWNTAAAVFGGNGAGSGSGSGGLAITYDDTDGGTIGPVIPGVAWKPLRLFSDTLQFYTNGATERMRITNAGRVGIGISTPSGPLDVRGATGTTAIINSYNTTTTGNVAGYFSDLQSTANSTSSYHYAGVTQGVNIWYLYGNGSSSWSSDQRLKKNIEATRDGYLDDLCKLRVVKYNWRTDDEDKPRELGLIAQEVEEVFPGLVEDALHTLDETEIKYKVLKGSVLPYMLLKAIQEANAKIDALEARLTAMEGK